MPVTSGQRCNWSPASAIHAHPRASTHTHSHAHVPLHRNSNTPSCQACRRHWNSFIKSLQDRKSFTINKRRKPLLLLFFPPTKQLAIVFNFDIYMTEVVVCLFFLKKSKLWYEDCCKDLKTLWKAINRQCLVAHRFPSMAKKKWPWKLLSPEHFASK